MFASPTRRKAKKTFEFQRDESDCGVAALLSVIQYFGGYVPLEEIRSKSGTTKTGTTLLGLIQASKECGIDAEAFKGSIDELKSVSTLTILHVHKQSIQSDHFVVCYGYDHNSFLIGDPDEGILSLSDDQLRSIWHSNALITTTPNNQFSVNKKRRKQKYDWLISNLKKDQSLLLSGIIIGIIIAILNFSTAIFTEKLVDNLIPSRIPSRIVMGIVAWFSLLLLKSAFTYLREILLIRQSYQLNNNLVGNFITRLFSFPKSFFDSRKKGDLIARLNDTQRIQTSIGTIVGQDIIDLLTTVVAILVITFYSTTVALFTTLLMPIYFSIIYLYYKDIYSINHKSMILYSINESEYIDNLTGIEALKQSNTYFEKSETVKSKFRDFQSSLVSAEKISAKFSLVSELFGLIAIVFIVTFCVTSVLKEDLQIGDLIAITSIASLAISSIGRLALATNHLQETRAALDRSFDLISTRIPENGDKNYSEGQNITLRNVSFGFPGCDLILKSIDMTIQKGNIYVLMGDNGSGKSTIIQLIQNFYNSHNGQILIDELSIKEINEDSLRSMIGVVPQEIKIFNDDLFYNITLNDEIDENQVSAFCAEYGFDLYFDQFPSGLFTVFGEEGVKPSGGQKQLIGLARALYQRPTFILLDEFVSSMNTETKAFAISIIKRISKDTGVLIISHDKDIQTLADAVYTLESGSITQMDRLS